MAYLILVVLKWLNFIIALGSLVWETYSNKYFTCESFWIWMHQNDFSEPILYASDWEMEHEKLNHRVLSK